MWLRVVGGGLVCDCAGFAGAERYAGLELEIVLVLLCYGRVDDGDDAVVRWW